MEIIDTHQHTWELERFDYSWCRAIPQLDRSFTLDDYLSAAAGLEIAQTVHVEADVDEPHLLAETRYILSLAERGQLIGGAVACARPEAPDFPDYLAQIAGQARLKGLRRILHTQPDELSRSEMFRRHVGMLADYGLSFDICALARQLPLAIELVQSCPGVIFILDHCGNPPLGQSALEGWRSDLERISTFDNVACKISGLATQADDASWRPEDLRPAVEHAIDCFGWDRVMFGSDWPVVTLAASLRRWVETLIELTAWAGERNQRKLFFANARRIYRL